MISVFRVYDLVLPFRFSGGGPAGRFTRSQTPALRDLLQRFLQVDQRRDHRFPGIFPARQLSGQDRRD